MNVITFKHAPTLRAAMLSSASVIIVQGPVESGKTTWGIGYILAHAYQMPRCLDGIRRSRWLVTREIDNELTRGPIRSWKQWFPEEEWGPVVGTAPAIHTLKFDDVELEMEFFAFADSSVKSTKRLRSVEYTGIYINEGQYRDLKFVKLCQQRSGRYPGRVECPAYNRKKIVIMDMNAPQWDDHWVHYMRGDFKLPADWSKDKIREHRKPDSWEFFVQPPTILPILDFEGDIVDFEINPDAENLKFQEIDEIMEFVKNGDMDDIKRDYMNKTVQIKSGSPRYGKFQRDKHVSQKRLQPFPNIPPIIGYDPGINGGATFWQKVNGRWRGTHEIFCMDNPDLNSAEKVGKRMIEILNQYFPWWKETGVTCWGDPFGTRAGAGGPEETYYKIIEKMGLFFQLPELKDSPSTRWQIGKNLVSSFPDGVPRLELCPVGMPMFVDAMDGGATMMTTKMPGGEKITEAINKKNKYADIMESAEYAWWGGGEANTIVEMPVETRAAPAVPHGRTVSAITRGKRSRGSNGSPRRFKRR